MMALMEQQRQQSEMIMELIKKQINNLQNDEITVYIDQTSLRRN